MLKSRSSDSELEFTTPSKGPSAASASSSKKKGKKKSNAKSKAKSPKKENLLDPSGPATLLSVSSSAEDGLVDDGMSSESSSDDAYGYGRQALGIDPNEVKGYDGLSTPTNGSQYLMHVMRQTKSTPKVAVAEISHKLSRDLKIPSYLEKFDKEVNYVPDTKKLDPQFIPSEGWRGNNLAAFSALREKVESWRELLANGATRLKTDHIKFPEVGNQVVWLKFCFGAKFDALLQSRRAVGYVTVDKTLDDYFTDLFEDSSSRNIKPGSSSIIKAVQENTELEKSPLSPASITTTSDVANNISDNQSSTSSTSTTSRGTQPLMSIMLILSQTQVQSLIYATAAWIKTHGFVNRAQGEWLYALLVTIDKPLEPGTMGDIRHICKCLISIRAKFCDKLTNVDSQTTPTPLSDDDNVDKLSDDLAKELSFKEEDSRAEEYLNALNLLIYLISDYFGQKDLILELE